MTRRQSVSLGRVSPSIHAEFAYLPVLSAAVNPEFYLHAGRLQNVACIRCGGRPLKTANVIDVVRVVGKYIIDMVSLLV